MKSITSKKSLLEIVKSSFYKCAGIGLLVGGIYLGIGCKSSEPFQIGQEMENFDAVETIMDIVEETYSQEELEEEKCLIHYFQDKDGDGFGGDYTFWLCEPTFGFVDNNLDCDDNNPNINPNIKEVPDSVDNNCDKEIDNVFVDSCEYCSEIILGGSDYDMAYSIKQTNDSGFIVLGVINQSYDQSAGDFLVLKLNKEGDIEWERIYGGGKYDDPYSLSLTLDGGYVVAGSTESNGAGKKDAWVLKLDKDGILEWEKTYGGMGDDIAKSVQQTKNLGYILAGSHGCLGNWVFKLNKNGEEEWSKFYGYGGVLGLSSIKQTNDYNYIAVGVNAIIKIDVDGNLLWEKDFGSPLFDIQQTKDKGYIAVGDIILKLNQNGEEEWVIKQNDPLVSDIRFASVQQTVDDGYITTGYHKILRIDEKGKFLWGISCCGCGLYSILQTSNGEFVAAGYTNGNGDNYLWDILVFRLDKNGGSKCETK